MEVSEFAHTGKFTLRLQLNNNSQQRSPEIEAIYVAVSDSWRLKTSGIDCPSAKIDGRKRVLRHLVKPSLTRLAPGAFSEERVQFSKMFWSKWGGEEKLEEYRASGNIDIEVETSEGKLPFTFSIDTTFIEIPF